MVHKNVNIPLIVKRNSPETGGCRSIVFERPMGFEFESGDWIDIAFEGEQLNGGITYSLSSSPTEPDLVITFKDGLSEIKRKLSSLRAGDKVVIIQFGNDYKFTLKPHRASVLIAGGVGIAPFRSMLKEMFDTSSSDQITLIYINKTSEFLFLDEINSWIRQLPHANIKLIITKDQTKKERPKDILSAIGDLGSLFYIAGPEGMVEDTEHLLLNAGVALADIKIDSFSGY
ncbi:FAD-dependent oxidoreductase [Candidatus Saccharibacteria bacterium]|nr:FAD-dependent oxidoreductase [Candidatus Saccharibacteria bacterium]